MRRALMSMVTVPLALFALAGSATAKPHPAPAPHGPKAHTSVTGGQDARAGEIPWQALVLPAGFLCGGSIVDATHILTAAHCALIDDDDDPHTPVIHATKDNTQVYAGVVSLLEPSPTAQK